MAAKRTPEEIRASIEQNRQDLGRSIETLRHEVQELTDWRAQLRRNQQQLTVAAVATGFILGGGIAGVGSLLFGGKARRARRAARALGE
jgi:hypothetical protein